MIGRTNEEAEEDAREEQTERERQVLRDVTPFVAVEPGGDERPDLVEDPGTGQDQPADQRDHEVDREGLERRQRDQALVDLDDRSADSVIKPAAKNCMGTSNSVLEGAGVGELELRGDLLQLG